MTDPRQAPPEQLIVLLVAAVHFINIIDFMMVAPLGPDLAGALDMATSNIGIVTGSYTLAAAAGSLLLAGHLDRFGRRGALVLALAGQGMGTIGAVLATDIETLVVARLVAGAFAGPATSVAIATLLDIVPPQRRGRAIGVVMGAFSAASVLGVPAGLELARLAGWWTPFVVVGALALTLGLAARLLLPALRGHVADARPGSVGRLLRHPLPPLALVMVTVSVMSGFLLIPNLSTFYQLNLGYPRESIGTLYLVGGAISFFTMRLAGRASDRLGPPTVAVAAVAGYVGILVAGFISTPPWLAVMPLFVGFMVLRTSLSVSVNTIVSWVPDPAERAAFMSLKTAMQHLAGAMGAFISAAMLSETASGALVGVPTVAMFAAALALTQPALMVWLHRNLKERR